MYIFSNLIIRFGQIFLWLYAKYLVRKKLRVDIDKCPIEPGEKTRLVISNHISHSDPFIFVGTLSWKEMSYIKPIRPMLAKWYFYSPLLPIAYLIGCYPTRPLLPILKRYSGLSAAIRYAQQKATLGIYPEGRRIFDKSRVPAKYGVIKILESVDEADIYIVHLTKDDTDDKHYSITYRKANDLLKERNPDVIMDRIFALGHN